MLMVDHRFPNPWQTQICLTQVRPLLGRYLIHEDKPSGRGHPNPNDDSTATIPDDNWSYVHQLTRWCPPSYVNGGL